VTMHVVKLYKLLSKKYYQWIVAAILGLVTLFSSIGLLATSGWFITAAGLAGVLAIEINYFAPSTLIRSFAILRTAGRYFGDIVSHNAALHLLKELRVQIFDILARPGSNLLNYHLNSAVAMHRLILDIDRLDLFPLRFVLPWIFSVVVTLIYYLWLYLLSPLFLWYVGIPILLGWLVIPAIGLVRGFMLAEEEIRLSEKSKEQLVQTLEMLTPLLLWKTWFTKESEWLKGNHQRITKNRQQQVLVSSIELFQSVALAAALLEGLYWGAQLNMQGLLSLPMVLAVVLSIMGMAECLLPLSASFLSLGVSNFAKKRINELTQPIDESKVNLPRPQEIKSLQLYRVSGRLPGALNGPNDVSFKLSIGDTLCLRGPSGVGKSTLLDIIAGEIMPQAGEIWLNNQEIFNWDMRNDIAYLRQDIDIFNLSLKENLLIGKSDASNEELWQVLQTVDLDGWAKSRQGLETVLGEHGKEISGGQARRIALARLLLADRSLILLDEPFAGLDENGIKRLYHELTHYAKDKIMLIVSHHDLALYGCKQYELSEEAYGGLQ
jgi:ABC-type transporter involved in cytochrome bd biosynthesis